MLCSTTSQLCVPAPRDVDATRRLTRTIALPTQDEKSHDTGWPGHGPQTVPSLAVNGETDVGGFLSADAGEELLG